MQTLDQLLNTVAKKIMNQVSLREAMSFALALLFAGLLCSCSKQAGTEVMDSDANGYLCLKCGAKLYTPRTVFIDPKCPKCQEDTLMRVTGYYCEEDKHLTIRPQRGDTKPIVCDICQSPLANAMRMPRENELKSWGAQKAP